MFSPNIIFLKIVTSYREQSFKVIKLVLVEAELVLVHFADQLDLLLLVLHRLLDVRLLVGWAARVGGAQQPRQVQGGLLKLILSIIIFTINIVRNLIVIESIYNHRHIQPGCSVNKVSVDHLKHTLRGISSFNSIHLIH